MVSYFVMNLLMEKTLSVYVESLNETWEMGDDMAIRLNEYYKENP
ncbi:MAG: hypothetical protein JWR72_1098 [Flavisolibacter sp.]|nr:hypothetical protein [Flavisolibacter sp.]